MRSISAEATSRQQACYMTLSRGLEQDQTCSAAWIGACFMFCSRLGLRSIADMNHALTYLPLPEGRLGG